MNQRYTLNRQHSRLEPIEKKCSYCAEGYSQSMYNTFFAPLYQENRRMNLVVYRSVTFNKLQIGVPRCRSCSQVHQHSKIAAWILSVSIIAVLSYLTVELMGVDVFSLLSASAIVILGFTFLPDLLTDKFVSLQGIKTEYQGAEKDMAIKEFLKDGWSIYQPTA